MRGTSKNCYRSGLEKRFAEVAPRGLFKYEPFKLPYEVKHDYLPDFVHKNFLIECKGFFRTGDTQKYKAIRDCIPTYELVFLLSDKHKKVRKGSKMTMEQWCTKEGFKCFTLGELDKLLKHVGIDNGSNT